MTRGDEGTSRDDITLDGRHKVEPEFGTSRRGFLVAMLMCGAVKPDAVTRRIVAEVELETCDVRPR